MATFSILERMSGVFSLINEEFIDAQWCRNEVPPHVDLTGRVILITGATSGTFLRLNLRRYREGDSETVGDVWGDCHHHCS
jgi:hypothetical protein